MTTYKTTRLTIKFPVKKKRILTIRTLFVRANAQTKDVKILIILADYDWRDKQTCHREN